MHTTQEEKNEQNFSNSSQYQYKKNTNISF